MAKQDHADYQLKGIPNDLWNIAKDKAAAFRPPVTMKHVILQLLYKWVREPLDEQPKHTTIEPGNKPIQPTQTTF